MVEPVICCFTSNPSMIVSNEIFRDCQERGQVIKEFLHLFMPPGLLERKEKTWGDRGEGFETLYIECLR